MSKIIFILFLAAALSAQVRVPGPSGITASGGGGGTISVTSSNCAGSLDSGTTSVTTIDSTGAGSIIVALAWYMGGSITSITDSKSNTWVAATNYTQVGSGAIRFYVATLSGGTRGTSHVITVTTSSAFPATCAAAITGATQYDAGHENGTNSATGTVSNLHPGSVTPSGANYFVCTGITFGLGPATGTLSIDSPLSVVGSSAYSAGNNLGVGLGCYQQSGGPTGINANWTWVTANGEVSANEVALKP